MVTPASPLLEGVCVEDLGGVMANGFMGLGSCMGPEYGLAFFGVR
jgi:hypothetical protein